MRFSPGDSSDGIGGVAPTYLDFGETQRRAGALEKMAQGREFSEIFLFSIGRDDCH